MKKLSVIAGVLCALLVSVAAFAQEEIQLDRAPVRDKPVELQSGARTFVNYCMGCHGLSAARYSQLEKLGLSEAEIKDNLMFSGNKIGDMMTVGLTAKDGKQFFGAAPPDLSVIARSRGADWLYSYLRSFYRDPSRPTGWNNMVFPNVGMPNVLWTLSGDNKLTEKEFDKEHDAEAAQRAIRALTQIDEKGGADKGSTKYTLKYLEQDKKGAQTPVEFDTTVADLVGFLVYIGEPHAAERKNLGYLVLFGLFLLAMFTYFLKKEFWSDVH